MVGAGVQRVLLCSGKVYYELLAHRKELGRKDVAIVRVEQLYPFPKQELAALLEAYAPNTPVVWVQDEPENMGAWPFLRLRFGERLLGRHPLSGAHRDESASPATGSAHSHKLEQQELIDRAFAPNLTAGLPVSRGLLRRQRASADRSPGAHPPRHPGASGDCRVHRPGGSGSLHSDRSGAAGARSRNSDLLRRSLNHRRAVCGKPRAVDSPAPFFRASHCRGPFRVVIVRDPKERLRCP